MTQSMTMEEALKIAIGAEIRAYNLYKEASEKIKGGGSKKMLLELAEQEVGHRKALEKVVAEKNYQILGKAIPKESRGIAEFLVTTTITENATPQEVIIFAMKEEEKAYNFYMALKDQFVGTDLEKLFDQLAKEEKGHKIKLEDEYDEHFLKEN